LWRYVALIAIIEIRNSVAATEQILWILSERCRKRISNLELLPRQRHDKHMKKLKKFRELMILMNSSQSPVDLAEVDRKLEAEVEVKRLSNYSQNCDSPGGSEATVDNWLFEMQLSRMISAAVRSITAGHAVFPSNSRATLCAVQKASSLCPFCMLRFLSR
jgi:hypothetical protein